MKLEVNHVAVGRLGVAPRAGAWIETYAADDAKAKRRRRPPRGGVD